MPLLIAAVGHAAAPVHDHGAASGHAGLPPDLPFPILIALAGLVFLGTLGASRLAIHLRLPAVLGVLALGLLLNPAQGFLTLQEVENLHVVSLSMLLFCSGLNANLHHIRGFLRFALVFTAAAVFLTTLIFSGLLWAIHAGLSGLWPALGVVPLPISVALLAAACVSCTDPSACLEVLHRAHLRLPRQLEALVVLEGSLNDSLAILLLLLMTSLASLGLGQPLHGHAASLPDALQAFLRSIGTGVMMGLILTYIGQFILRRFVSSPNQILLLGISLALSAYGLASVLHGSGFIAAYVTGLFLANDIYASDRINPEQLESSLEAFNTMMEFTVLLLFGTLIDPGSLRTAWLPGLLGALALVLIARPLSVMALQRWSPLGRRQGLMLSWCGLRGAVSLALGYSAIHALHGLPGLPEAQIGPLTQHLEGLIAVIVIGNLCLQGLTLPPLCRRLGFADGEP